MQSIDGATLVKARIAALRGSLDLRTGQDTPEKAVARAAVLLKFLLDEINPGAPAPAAEAAAPGPVDAGKDQGERGA